MAALVLRCECHHARLTDCDRTDFALCCREGEELTFEYRERSNRNDIALLHHFFLNERRPARLCAHDLPRPAHPSDMQEPFTDADYAPGGRLCTMVCYLLIFDLHTAVSIRSSPTECSSTKPSKCLGHLENTSIPPHMCKTFVMR